MESYKERRQTGLHGPSGSLLPSGRKPCPIPRKLYASPAKAHISKERCRLQISNYWHHGTKELEWPQEAHAGGEGEGCNPSASHGEGLAFQEETSRSTGCLKEGLLRGANLKENGFLIHNLPAI